MVSLSGLVLSGARGSWLGLAFGTAAIAIAGHPGSRARRGVPALVGGIILLLGAAWATGLLTVINERLFGTATSPGSFNQRFQALLAVGEASRRLPFLGVGFGGADEITRDVGLEIPNLENEYLRFFLAAGWIGPLALALLWIRRLVVARVVLPTLQGTAAIACLVGLAVNAGTYNMLSWSVGPTIVCAVAFLALPLPLAGVAPRHETHRR